MNSDFKQGVREGLQVVLPYSVGTIPWALVTGIAMHLTGLSDVQAMGMSLLAFAATAQLGTLPLIAVGAPIWLIFLTALVLNLRFVIFSAAMAPALHDRPWSQRLLSSYLLSDSAFILLSPRLLTAHKPAWRWGYYIGPALYGWVLWQVFIALGILSAGVLPREWSLEFMGTIALMVMLVPMCKAKPMLLAALTSSITAVLLHDLPLRLGLFAAIAVGMATGFVSDRFFSRQEKP